MLLYIIWEGDGMGAYKACTRCGRIHAYNEPCSMKKPTYHYERTGADRLRFTSQWKRKSLQVREDARYMCEVCRDEGKFWSSVILTGN